MKKATKAEQKIAVDAARAVIRIVEGNRGVVLAEAMAMLIAYHCAQMRDSGMPDPSETLGQYLTAIGERGLDYEAEGAITRMH